MRRVVVLALLAMALPMAAWANPISFTNQFGGITISGGGISTVGSELTSFDGFTPPSGQSLGEVLYSTGALSSGTIACGVVGVCATFSSTGSIFDVTGRGPWIKQLIGHDVKGSFTLFTGMFTGPLTWSLTSTSDHGNILYYSLSGDLAGTVWTGRSATGTTTQYFYTTARAFENKGIAQIQAGGGNIVVPEPGTLGLLGTGLLGIAGIFRRKMMR